MVFFSNPFLSPIGMPCTGIIGRIKDN